MCQVNVELNWEQVVKKVNQRIYLAPEPRVAGEWEAHIVHINCIPCQPVWFVRYA